MDTQINAADIPLTIERIDNALNNVDQILDTIEAGDRGTLHLKPKDSTLVGIAGAGLMVTSAACLMWYFTRSREERDAANQAVIDTVTAPFEAVGELAESAYDNVVKLFG